MTSFFCLLNECLHFPFNMPVHFKPHCTHLFISYLDMLYRAMLHPSVEQNVWQSRESEPNCYIIGCYLVVRLGYTGFKWAGTGLLELKVKKFCALTALYHAQIYILYKHFQLHFWVTKQFSMKYLSLNFCPNSKFIFLGNFRCLWDRLVLTESLFTVQSVVISWETVLEIICLT